ncbi:hypothetical protein FXO38_14902 [Capsicum annuum]|nr:hypothetical protein FXO38_14902 [Capsicum annuum]
MKDLVKNSQEIDLSVVPDSEISKYTQPDKIGEHSAIEKVVRKIDTDLGSTSVALVATEVLVDVGSVRKNVDDTSVGDKSAVIVDDTPVVPRRIRKPAAICESPYVSKFDSGCSNVQGQPTKCIDKGHSRKHIFSIKHPFTKSITEPFLDTKLLSSFNKFVDKSLRLNSNPVYSESVNNLTNAFDFGVVTIKTKEWFYTLGYAGVPLTDSVQKSYLRLEYDRQLGNNFTIPTKSVDLIKGFKGKRFIIYDANPELLKAFKGTNLQVSVMVPNELTNNIATNQTLADQRAKTNIVPFYPHTIIRYVLVGNEILSNLPNIYHFNPSVDKTPQKCHKL